ncbi:MAG: heavy metal translocating P-type ATPase [Moraxellaceae bacterium]
MSEQEKCCSNGCESEPIKPASSDTGFNQIFTIRNMDCPTEEGLIRKHLDGRQEISALQFNLLERKLSVSTTLSVSAMRSLLQEIGMQAVPFTSEGGHENGAALQEESSHAIWWRVGTAGMLALLAEGLVFAGMAENTWPVIVLSLLAIALGGMDTLRKGWIALKTFTLNINFLMSLAVAGAILIGQWPEAAMVTVLFAIAELIESYSLERARGAIQKLIAMAPETARIRTDTGQWQETEARRVTQGQIVQVLPGERVPLDGKVVSGRSTVNQAPITGESLPVEKQVGDTVFAGTINEHGVMEVKVGADYAHTTLARIIETVQEAQTQRAPTQRFVDEFARYYTPAVVLIALLVVLVPTLLMGLPFYTWLYRGLVLLVIACPCALVISTPVTVVSALAAAARQGILVKGGVYLEGGRKLTVIALDKTGTLTEGRPIVTDVQPLNQQPVPELIQLAMSLDANSTHPVAAAIVKHATAQGASPLAVTDFESLTGRGVSGVIAGQRYYLGNHRLIEELLVCSPAVEEQLFRLEAEGKTAVILATAAESLAILAVADTVRASSVEAVRELHAMGLKTLMLSGDNQQTAATIAAQVGIQDARGNLLPEDKLKIVSELQAAGEVVGMVGDGVNDAPALAKSFIGFAMGAAGTDTALETADVALMKDDLRKLPAFISLSRRASRVLWQNITVALAIKLVFFALALAGAATLWMAVFADMGASLIVVFNGLRLLRGGEGATYKENNAAS